MLWLALKAMAIQIFVTELTSVFLRTNFFFNVFFLLKVGSSRTLVHYHYYFFCWKSGVPVLSSTIIIICDSSFGISLSRPGFLELLWQGAQWAQFWKPCSSCTNSLLLGFSESLSKAWSHETFLFPWKLFYMFLRWLKTLFSTKTSNQRHCTNGISFWYLMKVQQLK